MTKNTVGIRGQGVVAVFTKNNTPAIIKHKAPIRGKAAINFIKTLLNFLHGLFDVAAWFRAAPIVESIKNKFAKHILIGDCFAILIDHGKPWREPDAGHNLHRWDYKG
jgi:hypothetical protein